MQKVLIAAELQSVVESILDKLEGKYQVRGSCEATEILAALDCFAPDYLLLDLEMPGLNWADVLRRVRQTGKPCRVVVMALFINDYIRYILEQYQVTCAVIKPSLTSGILAHLFPESDADMLAPAVDLRGDADRLLRFLGFRTELGSFKHILEAILFRCAYPDSMLVKEVYPVVAGILGGNWKQTERAIRTGINKAWQGRDNAVWARYFPVEVSRDDPSVPNGRFLERLVQVLMESLQEK